MTVAFSTEELRPRDRIPFWVDVATQTYFKHGFSASETFQGSLHGVALDSLALSRCVCSPCDVVRSRRDTASDDIDDFILGVRLSGRSLLTGEHSSTVIEPGSVYLQDSSKPLTNRFLTHATTIFVGIPRRALTARLGSTIASPSVVPKRPVAGLAAEFLTMLAARAETIADPLKPRLADQAVDLVALALAPDEDTPSLASPRAAARMRLKLAIDARLSDPQLKPADAAAAAGMSVRYANDLLAEEDFSLERFILHRRLERCQRALRDPLQAHRMIGEIAYSWGFSDHSHFTRRFRSMFGMTPGECRRQALAGAA